MDDPMDQAYILCRTLTTLISHLHPQTGFATSGQTKSADGRAYNHIATLLTRGVDDQGRGRNVIAVTGANTVNGLTITAASMASDSRSQLPPINASLSHPDMLVSQNDRSHDKFTRHKIKPNPKSLPEILKDLDVTNRIPLQEHAADVLKALMSMQGLHSDKERLYLEAQSLQLVLRRSISKIRNRILSVKYLYDLEQKRMDFVDFLRSWVVEPGEVLDLSGIDHSNNVRGGVAGEAEAFVLIPSDNRKIFNSHNFPQVHEHDNVYCQLNIQTAPKLVAILAELFQDLKNAAFDYKPKEASTYSPYLLSMRRLYVWIYRFSDFLEAICRVPSMRQLLYSNRRLRAAPRSNSADIDSNVEPVDDIDAEDIADLTPEPDESEGALLLRYLKTVVAWNRALVSLNKLKLFRTIPNLELNIVFARVPPQNKSMLSVDELMQILHSDLQSYSEAQRASIKNKVSDVWTKEFVGAIHSEAIIMGLAMACKNGDADLDSDFLELLQDSNRIVGVGKKSCWMCHSLGKKLADGYGMSFRLPGTSGIIFPWAPPFGIPLPLLQNINAELKVVLLEAFERILTDNLDKYQSAQSSPTSSSGDDFDYTLEDYIV